MRCLLLSGFLLAPVGALAQEADSAHDLADEAPMMLTLKMGAPAPWTGTLLSSAASAKIIASSDFALRECEARAQHSLNEAKIQSDFELKVLNSEINALTAYHDGVVAAKDKHISTLEALKNPPLPAPTPFYATPLAFATYGALGGALISVLSIHFAGN